MKELNLRNIALLAVVASWFIQIGGQLFALIAVDSVLVMAPPRSFAMLQGEYRYDSDAFWSTVPPITDLLLIVALIANWKTQRRKILLMAFVISVVVAVVSIFYVDPLFNALNAIGYRDEVDPALRHQAAVWHAIEWAVCGVNLLGGFALLLALLRPATRSTPTA
jgi:hypothetical protein